MRRRRRTTVPSADRDWSSEVSSGLALAGFLFVVFIGFTLLAMGPLRSIDAYFNVSPPPDAWVPVLVVLDRVGQRAVCLPLLAVVAYVASRRVESWRPAVVAAVSVFMLNLVVLILKVGLGRADPQSADPDFFTGGMAYPSGHSANIVLVYGLAAYLLSHYRVLRRRYVTGLWVGVAVLSVAMVITSLTLDWHWFADLVAGLLVGAMVLQLTASLNALVPVGVRLPPLRRAPRRPR